MPECAYVRGEYLVKESQRAHTDVYLVTEYDESGLAAYHYTGYFRGNTVTLYPRKWLRGPLTRDKKKISIYDLRRG